MARNARWPDTKARGLPRRQAGGGSERRQAGSRKPLPTHRPQLSRLLILLANLFCLYAAVGGLAWLVSSSSDRRGRAITILFLMLLSLFLLNYLVWCLRNNYTFFGDTTLAQFWHPLEKIAFLSPLHYHRPVNVLGTGAWPWRDMGVLLASGGAMWLTGGTVFARRDICTV